jgi:hypothetical protein
MSSFADTAETTLQPVLAEIADLDRQIKELDGQVDALKKRRTHLEKIAIEEMQGQRLDGVRVAGRSWRVEWEHSCSVTEGTKDAVMEAARKAGCLNQLTSVNTARLKAVLKEQAKEAGTDASQPWSAGTPFEGLVGEYVAPRLRHVSVG